MEVILRCCAGLDVHKDSVEACLRRLSAGGKVEHQVRHWGTTTRELVEMAQWLSVEQVTHVAMESTGVYWKPIFNILEERFEILLVNAHHLKNVPGRKTDIKDCQWIAQLLQHGLLKGSFILRDRSESCAILPGSGRSWSMKPAASPIASRRCWRMPT